MQDEAFFVHDTATGRKYWTPKGGRINVPCTGSHRKVTIYGSIASNGRQFFRTYDKFNAVTFVAYLKELQRHIRKAVLICDRAPQHRSRLVREFLRTYKNIKIMYFTKGSPYLIAVEECWRQGKRRLLVSEYYRTTLSVMCRAISTYYRTARFRLELINYVNKKTVIAPKERMIFDYRLEGAGGARRRGHRRRGDQHADQHTGIPVARHIWPPCRYGSRRDPSPKDHQRGFYPGTAHDRLVLSD